MIEINNLTTDKADKAFLKAVAKKVLAGEPAKSKAFRRAGLSIALVGQGKIKELNKRYRGKNKITDVLSFRYDDSGEVVICLREAKKNAKQFESTYKKELARVLIHGILHILGYNHESMKEKETHYLS